MRNIIRLTRPYQWMKNLFVFMPLVFGRQLTDIDSVICSIVAFLAFCLAASSIYCLNDIVDVEHDRKHPVKCNRPIASGAVSIRKAYVMMFVLIIISLAVLFVLLPNTITGYVVLLYWLVNIAYSVRLKHIAIIDVFILSFGFVLRIVAGGAAIHVGISHWLILMTMLLTLFLGFAKRRDDVMRYKKTGIPPRPNTVRYNFTFLNEATTVCGSVMLVCYIMYTVSPAVIASFNNHHIYLTSVYVLLGLLRYMQLAVVDENTGDPTLTLLRDRFMQVVVVAWLLTFVVIIYFL